MRIDELTLIESGGNRPVSKGKTGYAFEVIVIRKENGTHTWRGIGQTLPKGVFVGVARVLFEGDNDLLDEWPLTIEPVAVEMIDGIHSFRFRKWEWEHHDVSWTADGLGRLVAAQFRHI